MKTTETYDELCVRTKSDVWHGADVRALSLYHAIQNCIKAANELDIVKKQLFYGRNLDAIKPHVDDSCAHIEPHFIDLLHGIIGAHTETSELLELIDKTFQTDVLDTVNLAEEIGDVRWYFGIIMPYTGKTMSQIEVENIEKLTARFPDRFTEHDANNRDLDNERQVLEGVKITGDLVITESSEDHRTFMNE